MAGTIGAYQQGSFATPIEGGALDASVVLGNDNTVRAKHNSHDTDDTIHVQSSALASRPSAGTAQRVWVSTDGMRIYLDSGAAWNEIAYLPNAGGTVTGVAVFAGVTASAAAAQVLKLGTQGSATYVTTLGGTAVTGGGARGYAVQVGGQATGLLTSGDIVTVSGTLNVPICGMHSTNAGQLHVVTGRGGGGTSGTAYSFIDLIIHHSSNSFVGTLAQYTLAGTPPSRSYVTGNNSLALGMVGGGTLTVSSAALFSSWF